MFRINKKAVAGRLNTIINDKFNGTARQYANAAGVKTTTLQKYLDAISAPGGQNLVRLAEAAGVSCDWILTGSDFSTQGAEEKQFPQAYIISQKEFRAIIARIIHVQRLLRKGTVSALGEAKTVILQLLELLRGLRNQ